MAQIRYLLDTNICIALLNGREPGISQRVKGMAKGSLFLCSVVKAELLYGARKNERRAENERILRILFNEIESLPFDDEAAEFYGSTRAWLAQAGRLIGGNDLMIAAIAQRHGLRLATRNVREFERIPSLDVEGW